MEYTKKISYLSNQWYNDGLKKAKIRDLSGAITSLKKSLQYNRDNIDARNLLGLVYYGQGEVGEALVEWILSKNIRSQGNIATYFIKKIQESSGELEVINQAIKKYNQCLVYCEQDGEDLAAIQLRKVISAHPTFLKAYQLLALIYIKSEQYAKARQVIRKAHKLDTTNEITLLYMHELKQLQQDKAGKIKKEKQQAISYKIGNETIIQPVSATLRDNATMMTIVNIVIGIVVGAAVVWFLVFPTIKQNTAEKTNKEIIAYSELAAAKESEIDLLNKQLEEYEAQSAIIAQEKEIAQETQSSYEALVAVIEHYNQTGYDWAALTDELLAINTSSLGATGKTTYDAIAAKVFEDQCTKLYTSAKQNYGWKNYELAIESLERVMQINEGYKDGDALLILMKCYQDTGNAEMAIEKYNRILELYPDTTIAQSASDYMSSTTTTTTTEENQ